MASRERVECSKLVPPGTELGSCVSSKSTNILSHHFKTIYVAVEDVWNGGLKELPGCSIVPSPMVAVFA